MAGSAQDKKASEPPSTVGGRVWAKAVKIFKLILAQWLVIGFGLSCVFAYFFPSKLAGPVAFKVRVKQS